MKKKPWFLDRVLGNPPERNQVMHIVYGDGRVETIKAFAVVVTRGKVGLMIHPIPPDPSEPSASAMLVSIDGEDFPDAQLTIEPASANVTFIHSKSR